MTTRPHLLGLAIASATFFMSPVSAQVAITGATARPPAAASIPADDPRRPDAGVAAPRLTGNADSMLADAAEAYKYAVGVVVYVVPGKGALPIGTAWAFESNLFATNAHVVEAMEKVAKKGPEIPFFIAINQRPDKRLRVAGFRKHPKYGQLEARFDGKTPISAFDLGLIRTTEAPPATFTLASRAQLEALRSGTRIAFVGFPMESLAGANLDVQMPIATMQSGIVTSVSDNYFGDSGFENNRLIRHSLPATGGASGSPIFTPDGAVVAILWGINMQPGVVASRDGFVVERDPSAALVNFAERIDGLAGVPRP